MLKEHIERVWIDYPSAERYSGLSHTTLWRYVTSGDIRAARIGRSVRIYFPSLEQFMQTIFIMHILGGALAQPLDPDKPFQHVAVEDVGAFAAIAFEHPEEWIGREVDLGGDEQTMPEIAETFGRVIGREISYYQVPWDQFEEQMGEEVTVQYRWLNDVGYEADIAALRQEYPELTTFERYLRSHGWEGAEVPAGG